MNKYNLNKAFLLGLMGFSSAICQYGMSGGLLSNKNPELSSDSTQGDEKKIKRVFLITYNELLNDKLKQLDLSIKDLQKKINSAKRINLRPEVAKSTLNPEELNKLEAKLEVMTIIYEILKKHAEQAGKKLKNL